MTNRLEFVSFGEVLEYNDSIASRQVSEHRAKKGDGQARRRGTPALLSEIALLGENDSGVTNGHYEWSSKKARSSPDATEHSEKVSSLQHCNVLFNSFDVLVLIMH